MEDEATPLDDRLEVVQERLQQDLVDEAGHPAPVDVVEAVVAEKAEPLSDAPVQDFVPLLVERQARDELRRQGLTRTLPDELREPVDPDAPEAADTPGDRFEADPA